MAFERVPVKNKSVFRIQRKHEGRTWYQGALTIATEVTELDGSDRL